MFNDIRLSAEQLQELIRGGESQTVEFKRQLPPDSIIAQALVAFANTTGGVLIVGVSDDGDVVGLDPPEADAAFVRLQAVAATVVPHSNHTGLTSIGSKRIVFVATGPAPEEKRPLTTATGEALVRRGSRIDALALAWQPPSRHAYRRVLGFVAMSFRTEEEPALEDYWHAMNRAAAATRLDMHLERIDLREGDYEISTEIMKRIVAADFVIADFTLSPQNVYFEAGFARGSGKRLIQTARQGTTLEFDTRNWRTILYRNATELEAKLQPALVEAYEQVAASS